MARFTKELRQQIVREFAEGHGGMFDPAVFLASVRDAGPEHPAWEWFDWNDETAANEYRLDQARDFARGLVVRFEVKVVHRGTLRVVEKAAPLALSPLGGRNDGGGYYLTDPDDPAHMEELCRQAAQSLRWFVSRYEAALAYAGVGVGGFDKALDALESPKEQSRAA